jgi:uncharacterized protein YbjT (DUF2867 family)
MPILVTGATGKIGSQLLGLLAGQRPDIRALTRTPEKAQLPAGVTAVKGDLGDVDSVRAALKGVTTLFLLVPNSPDELTKAMQTLNLARDAGVKGVVYLSVIRGEEYSDVPHFASKATIERMIKDCDVPATILRPAYFIQNDVMQKDALLTHGVYGMPIGNKGVSMVDVRDIAEAAAKELLHRENAPKPLPVETYELVGPDALTGASVAKLWGEILGKQVGYAGDDLSSFEDRIKSFAPSSVAYDLVVMMRRYQTDGAVATATDLRRLTALLGHPPRSYRDFAAGAAESWKASNATKPGAANRGPGQP